MEAGRPRDPECDLNGRWLLAQRNALNLPLSQCQAVHTWYYYEIRHVGDQITVQKGLHCGYESVKISALSATVVNETMRPAELLNNRSDGRTGTYVKEANQCRLVLPVEHIVRGATVSYYKDPSRPLPVMGSAAAGPSGAPPGWEDWDNDTNPGFTLNINSPGASGNLYLCTRDTNAIDGLGPLSSAMFKVPMSFTSLQSVLGTSPGSSSLITMGGTPSSNASTHFTYFMKLQDGQAVGTDTEICEQVRTLRNSLPGDANEMPPPTMCP